jgi:hypothetical protein
MKFALLFVTSVLVWMLLGFWLPYWAIMAVLFLVAVFVRANQITAFMAIGLGVGAVWLFFPLYLWLTTDSQLPMRMSEIFGLKNSTYLLGITGLIGFLLGGFSGLTGNLLGNIFHRR